MGANRVPTVTLMPGEFFAEAGPHQISTLLGSCVAVCLWDRRLRDGGMTHSLLPTATHGKPPSAQFTDVAIDWLVQAMLEAGATRGNLVAKLFGGAFVLGTPGHLPAIGDMNVDAACRRLSAWGIPLIARCTGGTSGYQIKFDTPTGDVWVRRLGPAGKGQVARDPSRRSG